MVVLWCSLSLKSHLRCGCVTLQVWYSVLAESSYRALAYTRSLEFIGGVTGFLGSLKISLCEERRFEDIQNLKCEDGRYQICLVLTPEDSATKPTKVEDWRFNFLTGKIWFLSVFNWEDRSWWYLPLYCSYTCYSNSFGVFDDGEASWTKWFLLLDLCFRVFNNFWTAGMSVQQSALTDEMD